MKKTVVRLTFLCVGLVFTSLVLTSISDAQFDMTSARAIWLFDEGEGETQSQWANILSSHGGDPGPPVNCRGMSIEQISDSTNLFSLVAGGAPRQCWLGQATQTQLETGVWQHFVIVRQGAALIHYLNGEVSAEGSAQKDTPYAPSHT